MVCRRRGGSGRVAGDARRGEIGLNIYFSEG
jgi:hypothetical protein